LRLRPGFYSRIRIIEVGGTPDQIVGVGQEGELIIDANVDTIFSSYLNRPDATAEALRDGWYYSGDVCLKHENGDMDLIGRVDDMIRSGGENIHPSEVEPTLESHPAIKEVSLIGIPDPKWGEMVVACLTAVDSDWVVEAAELDTFMKESTVADFKRPKAYVFMNALPRNAANKILRRELREIAVNTQAGDGDWDFVTV
jgi:acyl-CoA synthetase (AMP-forming)/AMP-acid ligase II